MITPQESSRLFLVAVFSNLAVSLLLAGFIVGLGEEEMSTTVALLGTLLIQAVYVAVYGWLVPGKNRVLRWPIVNKRLERKRSPAAFAGLMGLCAALGALSLGAFFLPTVWFDGLLSLTGYEGSGIEFSGTADIILGGVIVVLVAPVVEEFIFRGALLSGLSRSHGVPKAVLLTSFAFMLSHMNPSQTLYQFLLAVVCGFAVVYTGTLLAGVVIHAASNLCALLLELTPLGLILDELLAALFGITEAEGGAAEIGGSFAAEIGNPFMAAGVTAGALALFGGLILLILFYFKKAKPKEEEPPPLKEIFYRVSLSPLIPPYPLYPGNAFHPGLPPPPDPFAPPGSPPQGYSPPDSAPSAQNPYPPFFDHPAAPGGSMAEPPIDIALTEAVHAAKKTSARVLFWTACVVCAAFWGLGFLAGLGLLA